jgi:hypothetical protein
MQKWISPASIFGRKRAFCSSVPKFISVGPTVLIVSIGTGAPARIDSSKKMNCSTGVRPWPPCSVGQPMPNQPSSPICRTILRLASPTPCPSANSASTSGVSSSP